MIRKTQANLLIIIFSNTQEDKDKKKLKKF